MDTTNSETKSRHGVNNTAPYGPSPMGLTRHGRLARPYLLDVTHPNECWEVKGKFYGGFGTESLPSDFDLNLLAMTKEKAWLNFYDNVPQERLTDVGELILGYRDSFCRGGRWGTIGGILDSFTGNLVSLAHKSTDHVAGFSQIPVKGKGRHQRPNWKPIRRGLARSMRDLWLGFALSVQPQIQAIAEAASQLQEPLFLSRQRGSARQNRVSREPGNLFIDGLQEIPISCGRVRTTDAKAKVVDLAQTQMIDDTIIGRLGFSRESVLTSLWEWTPYSWLVDYFLNVGDWLHAFEYERRWSCFVSETTSLELTDVVDAAYPTNGWHGTVSSLGGREPATDYFAVSRSIVTSPYMPPLRLKLPSSPRQAINAFLVSVPLGRIPFIR